jgi:hypothetical protein
VQQIPAFVVADKSGEPARPLTVGAMSADEFLAWLARPSAPATQPATVPSATTRPAGE